jgi:hypothetical protein
MLATAASAVTSLTADFGLTGVVAFFFADRVVICDLGALPSPSVLHPQLDAAAWCDTVRAGRPCAGSTEAHRLRAIGATM